MGDQRSEKPSRSCEELPEIVWLPDEPVLDEFMGSKASCADDSLLLACRWMEYDVLNGSSVLPKPLLLFGD